MSIWMIVSGLTGASCFVIIHFTKLFKNPIYAAWLQLMANAFVFTSWGAGFLNTPGGIAQRIALIGTIVPVIMASITVRKVFWRQQIKSAD